MHATALLVASLSTLGLAHISIERREQCNSISAAIAQLGSAGSGGRKVGFVIDASGSMSYNDPDNLRLKAAEDLNGALIDSKEASASQPADQVVVVDFSDEGDTRLLYPLGDPSGADAAISQVNVRGQTFIGGGIIQATNAIIQSGGTQNRSALVVFTDGVDNTDQEVEKTIQSIIDAGKAGIRVHFGFLDTTADAQDPQLITAILDTNGIFSTISAPDDIDKFVVAALAKGLAASDHNGGTMLLPSLTASAQLVATGPTSFQYMVRAGERINITVDAITNGLQLKQVLKTGSGVPISEAQTNATAESIIKYTATADDALSIDVTGLPAGVLGLFSIKVQSTLACGGISQNMTKFMNNTSTSNTTNYWTPEQFTGTAASVSGSFLTSWRLSFVFAAATMFLL